jgi:hypothetical protein
MICNWNSDILLPRQWLNDSDWNENLKHAAANFRSAEKTEHPDCEEDNPDPKKNQWANIHEHRKTLLPSSHRVSITAGALMRMGGLEGYTSISLAMPIV